jgi:hypothetical protein
MDKRCTVCDKMFYAQRATAKFCNATCRKRYSRDVNDDPIIEPAIEQPEHKIPQTQEEIEAYYTLKNFPRVKYYSLNGGGQGSYSPYPKSDPRSKAYLDE